MRDSTLALAIPGRILAQSQPLPRGVGWDGYCPGARVHSPSQCAGAALGSHLSPQFCLLLCSLFWELSSGHPGWWMAPWILSTEGKAQGCRAGLARAPPSPTQPRACLPTDTLEQVGLFSDMHLNLSKYRPVHHTCAPSYICSHNPACPAQALATWPPSPHPWPSFSTVTTALPGSSWGRFGINHCQCEPLPFLFTSNSLCLCGFFLA